MQVALMAVPVDPVKGQQRDADCAESGRNRDQNENKMAQDLRIDVTWCGFLGKMHQSPIRSSLSQKFATRVKSFTSMEHCSLLFPA
jgi:hypothetical protein